MKKFISILMSAAILVTSTGLVPVYAEPDMMESVAEQVQIEQMNAPVELMATTASGTCGDNLTWTLENGTLTINGAGDMYDYDFSKGVEAPWYSNRNNITTVVVENGVTSIGADSFYNCLKLTDVTLPESVTTICEAAFSNCSSLTNFTIPDSTKTIMAYVFEYCYRLTSVTIPNSITSIGESAFNGSAVTDVYYNGTHSQWNGITIESGNEPLVSATTYHTQGNISFINGTYTNSTTTSNLNEFSIGEYAGDFTLEHDVTINSMPADGTTNKNDNSGFFMRFNPFDEGIGTGWYIKSNNGKADIVWKSTRVQDIQVVASELSIDKTYTFKYTFSDVGTNATEGACVGLIIVDSNGITVGSASNLDLRNMSNGVQKALPLGYVQIYNQANENSVSSVTIDNAIINYKTPIIYGTNTETISYTYSSGEGKTHERKMEKLDRGLVAVNIGDGVYLSWRLLDSEDFRYGSAQYNVSFNVYRGSAKIATVADSTNYTDITVGTSYSVAPVINGIEGEKCKAVSVQSDNYFDIPIQKPADVNILNIDTGLYETCSYSANEASCGDFDGDGEYEIILKWDCNGKDNSQSGYTGNVLLDAYKLDGTLLWRVDLGQNIRAGAHYTQFLVYDFDGDGKAEMITKTAPGSKDSAGKYVTNASHISEIRTMTSAKNEQDFRNDRGYILDGDEFLTVFDSDGKAVDTIYYPNQRIDTDVWGDNYGNRSERFTAAIAYMDGEKPYAVFMRGYYMRQSGRQSERQAACAVSFDGAELECTHSFDTYDAGSYANKNTSASYLDGVYKGVDGYQPEFEKYVGNGNHNCTVADVDGDGKDEVITGALCYEFKDDDSLAPRWCTFMEHGDALHIGDYDPTHEGFEFFTVHEDEGPNTKSGKSVDIGYGMSVIDADTGEIIFHEPASRDTGRGVMANIGMGGYYQIWSSNNNSLYKSNGRTSYAASSKNGLSVNFRIFWDGDLYDELLDGTKISKWSSNTTSNIFTANACVQVNGTKANPSLQADLFGDWREEVIYPTTDGTALRVYTTTTPTDYKIKTLMHDPIYRSGVANEQTGYNQPPHVGMYLSDESYTSAVPKIYQYGTCGDNLTWTLDRDGTLTISGTGAMYDWEDGDKSPWFSYRFDIKKIVMKEGITSIGQYGFRYLVSAEEVEIPDSLTSMGRYAFQDCRSIKEINISKYVTSIDSYAFMGMLALENINVAIENPNYKSIDGVLIENGELIAYPEGNTRTEYTVPDEVKTIGRDAFYRSYYLEKINLPDSVTRVRTYAFVYCTALKEISIPKTVTAINGNAFAYCSALTDVYYGGTESEWNNITIDTGNDPLTAATIHYTTASGKCGDNLTWVLYDNGALVISGTGDMTDYSKTTSPWYSYRNSLKSIVLESGVTNIGSCAFYVCSSLTSVTIPNSVTSIGTNAFSNCLNLASVTIPNSVTSIGDEAFFNCRSLTSVIIPDSVTSIGADALSRCAMLMAIDVDTSNQYYCSEDGILFDKDKTSLITYPAGKADDSYEIPNGVISIGNAAFKGCTSLASITIPNSVTSIGAEGFYECASLTNLTIPDGITSIESRTFYWCSGLTSITIPNSVTSIGTYAFFDCESLANVTIPNGVTNIEVGVFSQCTSLTSVTIPNSVTSIGSFAFDGCTALTDVYYGGTESEWNDITIDTFNAPLTSATIHYAEATVLKSWKFDFGTADNVATGYTAVTPDRNYITEGDYGFLGIDENGYEISGRVDGFTQQEGQVIQLKAGGRSAALYDGIGSVGKDSYDNAGDKYYPVRFAMKADDDAYYRVKATVTTLDRYKPATASLYTERKHQIFTDKTIAAGEWVTTEFTVRVTPVYYEKSEPKGTIADGMLNICLLGENTALAALEIDKIDTAPTVWLLGDSTVTDGWGTLPFFPLQNYTGIGSGLTKYLPSNYALVNEAEGGLATSDTLHFNMVRNRIKEGDYLYLEYGHNDQKSTGGVDGYKTNLDKYYNLCNTVGAKLIIVSPIERINTFSEGAYQHTLRDIAEAGQEYVTAKVSAGATDIAYVDLNQYSLDWYNKTTTENNDEKAIYYYFRTDKSGTTDKTHENDLGADNLAYQFMQAANAVTDTAQKAVLAPLLAEKDKENPSALSEEVISGGIGGSAWPVYNPNGTCGDNLTWLISKDGTLNIAGIGSMYDYSGVSSQPWYGYTNLITKIKVDAGVTTIGSNAFRSLSNVTEVFIPKTVINIGYAAFYDLTALSDIYYSGTKTEWDNITIGENNTSLDSANISCLGGADSITCAVMSNANEASTAVDISSLYSGDEVIGYHITIATSKGVEVSSYDISKDEVTDSKINVNTDSADKVEVSVIFETTLNTSLIVPNGRYAVTALVNNGRRSDLYANDQLIFPHLNLNNSTPARKLPDSAEYIANDIVLSDNYVKFNISNYLSDNTIEKIRFYQEPSIVTRKKRIYITGESLVCDYYGEAEAGNEQFVQTGWGMVLSNYLNDSVNVTNLAASGYWTTLMLNNSFTQIEKSAQSGDILLLECGYNDRTWLTSDEMIANIKAMVAKAREKGMEVFVVTYNASLHDYGTGSYANWKKYVLQAAEECNVPAIDLFEESYEFLNSRYGDLDETERKALLQKYYHTEADTLHSNYNAANCWASLVAQHLYDNESTKEYVNINHTYTFNDSINDVTVKAGPEITASGKCGDNLTWVLDEDGTLTVSGTGTMTDYNIASNVPWSNYLNSIKSVVINEGVTKVGIFAFDRCSSLETVSIAKSVTLIGNAAFYECTALTDVYFEGTQNAWNAITVGEHNEPLKNAMIHYIGAERKFDFGSTGDITADDEYTDEKGYGFDDTSAITTENGDVKGSADYTFKIKVPNGNYTVNVDTTAESITSEVVETVTATTGITKTGSQFDVAVCDGVLDLTFPSGSTLSSITVTQIEKNTKREKPAVYAIGDSTTNMTSMGAKSWGNCISSGDVPLPDVFSAFENRGRGGRDSVKYYNEGSIEKMLLELCPDDYVTVNMGLNSSSGETEAYETLMSEYYVQAIIDRGGIPIIVTATPSGPVGNYVNSDYNSETGKFTNSRGDGCRNDVLRNIAANKKLNIIELGQHFEDYFNSLTMDDVTAYNTANGTSHTSVLEMVQSWYVDRNHYTQTLGKKIGAYIMNSLAAIAGGSNDFSYENDPYIETEIESKIKIGDYLKMGTYYGEPILWRCVDIDENGPLMLSDKIICLKPFDAFTSANSETGSHSRGDESNYWGDSNMRSWLSSTASAGNVNWLCGNPPIADRLAGNAYADEAGFLTHFSWSEINAMKAVSQKSLVSNHEYENGIYTTGSEPHEWYSNIADVVANYDSAYAEYVTDKMFLMDVKQVNAVYNNRAVLGDNYYIGEPTAEAVANSEIKAAGYLEAGKKWYYWLRSPNASNNHSMRSVDPDGSVGGADIPCPEWGVRPAFYLNLSSVDFDSGVGTENDAYMIDENSALPKLAEAPSITVNNIIGGKSIVLASDTLNAHIYYTLDNSEPTEVSAEYTEPIIINKEGTVTIKAIAVADGYEPSNISSETIITEKLGTPAATPIAGRVLKGTAIRISVENSEADIYYTLDGTLPTVLSKKYTEPIQLGKTSVIKAIAMKQGYISSDVFTAEYTVYDKCATPEISVSENQGVKTVTVTCDTEDVEMYYTTDGSTPSSNSKRYTDAVVFNEPFDGVFKIIAIKADYDDSDVVSENITVTKTNKPSASVEAGTVLKGTELVLSGDGTIYYSINGGQEQIYSKPIVIDETMTLKAYAIVSGSLRSDAIECEYTVENVKSGTDGSITWNYADGELVITGRAAIPDYTAGKAPWSHLADEITQITIGNGIDTIGTFAFSNLAKVEEVSVSNSIMQINDSTFEGCKALKQLNLPDNMNSGIGANAFKDCVLLETVTVPKNVKSIGAGAFDGCVKLKEITVPFVGLNQNNTENTFGYIFNGNVPDTLKKVTVTNARTIPKNAFAGLDKIEEISVNDGVTSIGNSAFDGCKSLKTFAIPQSVRAISDNTFRGCESATEINVPNTVTSIGVGAFDSCKKLKSINISSGVKYLYDNTFRNCESITSIEIPTTVISIGESVLEGCKSIKSIKVPFVGANANPGTTSVTDKGIFGYLFGTNDNKDVPPAVTRVEITGTDIGNYIPQQAFKDCANVVDIIIDGGGSVLAGAFENCRNLKNLYVPKSVSTIGKEILVNCTNIETLTIPFIGMSRLDKNSPTSVLGAFFGYDDDDITGTIQYYNENGDFHHYKVPKKLKNVAILNQTTIPKGAFQECRFIEKVTVVSGATMNEQAFYDCISLKSVTLPNDLQTIGKEAFAECEQLETINIPTKVRTIGEQAFYDCRNLQNVTMPNSVTEIADDVFNGTNLFSEVNLFAQKGTITCSEGSEAYKYAVEHGIQTNVVPSSELDIRNTATTVTLLSDGSYLFDVIDAYNLSGTLHIELYNSNNQKLQEKTTDANKGIEYRVEFTDEEMSNVSYAEVYIEDDGTMVTTDVEMLSVDGGAIPEQPESNIELSYENGVVTLTGEGIIKSGTVLIQAIYNGDNSLDKINIYPVTSISEPINVSTEFDTGKAKFMLWNSIDKMQPIADAMTK